MHAPPPARGEPGGGAGRPGGPQTGVVNPGDAAVLPAPLLVSQAGTEIIDGTSTTPVVTIALDARDQTLARVGESVDVQLPNNQDVKGWISAVGSVATTSGQGSSQTTTVPVTVTLADSAAASRLDGASVTVERVLGPDHPDTVATRRALAELATTGD